MEKECCGTCAHWFMLTIFENSVLGNCRKHMKLADHKPIGPTPSNYWCKYWQKPSINDLSINPDFKEIEKTEVKK